MLPADMLLSLLHNEGCTALALLRTCHRASCMLSGCSLGDDAS
jgi:hypothetical protein